MLTERICTLFSRKLLGEATDAEMVELCQLLNENKVSDKLMQIIETYWHTTVEDESEYLEASFILHSQKMTELGYDLSLSPKEDGLLSLSNENHFKNRNYFAWLIAAAAILIICIGIYNLYNKNEVKAIALPSEVSTKNGSRTKIKLPDGSDVWLNGNSKILYNNEDFGRSKREVTLLGEAYFDVVKNAAKPFIIHTSKLDIKVLGTAFNVKCYPGEKTTETTLIRGSIEATILDRREKIMLKPNEKLIINDIDNFSTKKENAKSKIEKPIIEKPTFALVTLKRLPQDSSIVETAWVNNKLAFSDESFEDIAIKMKRWYGVDVIIKNEELKKVKFTGNFEKENIYQALAALKYTTSFSFKENKNGIEIYKTIANEIKPKKD